ncbi:MAG: S49 family peptidase [Xanthobacteraceae bacterium]|nr:S49 family peptidase [Xanthobacteraceae bacterium]QYK45570.1 MAG: S49 family peptidase [Xanthobacteraceae bacterium]
MVRKEKEQNGFFSRLFRRRPVVPVVRLSGAIGISMPLVSSMSLASVSKQLDRAFAYRRAPAVALVVNSPGGAPAQSHLIYQRIRQLAEKNKKKVFVFVEDVAASGGYMIACAADEIFADPYSIVGSVGVVSASFGFEKMLKKAGIERRVYTAGDNKRQLDAFLPAKPEDIRRLKALQTTIHAEFIALVKRSRGKRLAESDKTLFNGEYWLAEQATAYGLIDGVGDVRGTLQKRYGANVALPLIAPPGGLLSRRIPGLSQAILGPDGAKSLLGALEERALWGRYGL